MPAEGAAAPPEPAHGPRPGGAVEEAAPAKVNLVLHVGPRRADGLHELCSLFASLELADRLTVALLSGLADEDGSGTTAEDRVECPAVEGPNLVNAALGAYRAAGGALGPVEIRVEKEIPVAAGLGGGSADAAAVLRAADALARRPLGVARLREVAMRVGADVPSQVSPGHAIVTGAGEHVEPMELPQLAAVLVPQAHGLATARVYAELDRRGGGRPALDVAALRRLVEARNPRRLLEAVENDLEPAALALRPELASGLASLRAAGADAALVTGSGPTLVGLFGDEAKARAVAAQIDDSILTRLRGSTEPGAAPPRPASSAAPIPGDAPAAAPPDR